MDLSHFEKLLYVPESQLVGVGTSGSATTAVSSAEIKAAFTTQEWRPPQLVEGKGPEPGARLAMIDKMSLSKDEGICDVSEPEDEPKIDTCSNKDKETNECGGASIVKDENGDDTSNGDSDSIITVKDENGDDASGNDVNETCKEHIKYIIKGTQYVMADEKYTYASNQELYKQFAGSTAYEEARRLFPINTIVVETKKPDDDSSKGEEGQQQDGKKKKRKPKKPKEPKPPNMKFAYWMGIQVTEGVYRPVFFDTRVLVNKSYTLNCSLLQIKSASKVSEIKDREDKIASHVRSLNTAIRTVDNIIKNMDMLTIADVFVNACLYAGVRVAGVTCARTTMNCAKKQPIFIDSRTLNFVTGSTLPSLIRGIFKGSAVDEDTEILLSICQALKRTRERERELRANLGETRYPNSVAGQKTSWLDFFNDLLNEETITKENIIFHTLRSLQDAASNIYVAFKEAYAQGKTIIPGLEYFKKLRRIISVTLTPKNMFEVSGQLVETLESSGGALITYGLKNNDLYEEHPPHRWGEKSYTQYLKNGDSNLSIGDEVITVEIKKALANPKRKRPGPDAQDGQPANKKFKSDLPEKDIKSVMVEVRKLKNLKDNEELIQQTIKINRWLLEIHQFALRVSHEISANTRAKSSGNV